MSERRSLFTATAVLIALAASFLAGCAGTPLSVEQTARADVRATGAALLANEGRPALPVLHTDSSPAEFMRYAVLNHPGVTAAYYDWRASVAAIAPARSLPDPKLTFQADITDTLMSFMPGLMFDLMGAGKLAAMGREAASTAGVTRQAYIAAVLNTAAEARQAWIELAFVDEALRLRTAALGELEHSLAFAHIGYTTGSGMATLADQIRLTNDVAKMRSDLAALADRRTAVRARFKSALGLAPADPDPAWPAALLVATVLPDADELWHRVTAANAELGRMRAMVEMTVAGIDVARQIGRPDFTVGAMVDLKANPLMFRPTASLSLPIWRGKIAASIAAAEARRDASVARVSAAQLNLASEFAQMLFSVRESDRMIAYIDHTALPNLERMIASAEAGYQSGMTKPGMIPATQLMAVVMRLERVAALRERESAVTALLLLAADVAPTGLAAVILAQAEAPRSTESP